MKPVIPAWAATWIEHWPAELLALSFDQRGLALRPNEVRALGRRNGRAVAAFGAWRTARDFDWSPLARAVVALLSAIPMLGMAVCLGLLFKAFRAR